MANLLRETDQILTRLGYAFARTKGAKAIYRHPNGAIVTCSATPRNQNEVEQARRNAIRNRDSR